MTRREHLPWSEFRRLLITKGKNHWWVNTAKEPNGIAPICLFCDNLIDWNPNDHSETCPVPKFIGFEGEV